MLQCTVPLTQKMKLKKNMMYLRNVAPQLSPAILDLWSFDTLGQQYTDQTHCHSGHQDGSKLSVQGLAVQLVLPLV